MRHETAQAESRVKTARKNLICAFVSLGCVGIAGCLLGFLNDVIGLCALYAGVLGGYVAGYVHAERVAEAETETSKPKP
jgi:hypothetical protein